MLIAACRAEWLLSPLMICFDASLVQQLLSVTPELPEISQPPFFLDSISFLQIFLLFASFVSSPSRPLPPLSVTSVHFNSPALSLFHWPAPDFLSSLTFEVSLTCD